MYEKLLLQRKYIMRWLSAVMAAVGDEQRLKGRKTGF
jgi:hypothetical protein